MANEVEIVVSSRDQTKPGFESAEKNTQEYGSAVEKAAARVQAARTQEENAAGRVRVAELQLTELRASGSAKASQLAAAEERLAAAHRGLAVAQERAASAVAQYEKAQRDAVDTTEKAQSTVRRAAEGVNRFGGSLARIGRVGASSFAQIAGGMAALNTGIGVIAGVGSVAVSASGALGLIPAAAAAAGGALVAVALGGDGIKKAFEKAVPALDTLKAKVSASFEQGLAPAVANVNRLLPGTTVGLKSIATALSGVAVQFTAMLTQAENQRSLNGVLSDSSRITQNLGRAVAPLGQAFLDVASVGATMFREMTVGAGGAAQRVADWVRRMKETGNIRQWMQTGIDTFREIGAVLGDLAAIVGSVFSALREGGAGVGSALGPAVAAVREFVQSAQGQETFRALGRVLATVGQVVSQVLGTALVQVGPLIPPLADAFGQLATQALPLVLGALKFIGPILLNIATFIAQNIGWLGRLAIALAILTAAQWALNIALDANPIGLVIMAVAALVAIVATIITYWQPISGFFKSLWDNVWKWTSDRVTAVRDFITSVFDGIGRFFSSFGDAVASAFQSTLAWFASLPGKIGSFLAALPGVLWNAFTTALMFALNAVVQGLEWVIAEIIAFPMQVGWVLVQFGQLLWNGLTAAWQLATTAVVAAVEWLVSFIAALPGRVMAVIAWLPGALAGWASQAWTWVTDTTVGVVNGLLGFVQSIPGRIVGLLSWLGGAIAGLAANAWQWFVNTTISVAGGIWGFISSIPGRIMGALGDLGNLLWNAGAALINGLLNGIKSAAQGVFNFVSGIASKVAALKGPLPYDQTVLIPNGQALMDGLHTGLQSGFGPVRSLVSGMAGQIAGAIPDQFSASVTASGARAGGSSTRNSSFGGSPTGVTIRFDTADAPPLVQALVTELQRYVRGNGGDVQTVLGRG